MSDDQIARVSDRSECNVASECERALEQACRDLQQAHDEVLRAQGCAEADFVRYSWPAWTPQANTIRWAEKLLGKDLSKAALRG